MISRSDDVQSLLLNIETGFSTTSLPISNEWGLTEIGIRQIISVNTGFLGLLRESNFIFCIDQSDDPISRNESSIFNGRTNNQQIPFAIITNFPLTPAVAFVTQRSFEVADRA